MLFYHTILARVNKKKSAMKSATAWLLAWTHVFPRFTRECSMTVSDDWSRHEKHKTYILRKPPYLFSGACGMCRLSRHSAFDHLYAI